MYLHTQCVHVHVHVYMYLHCDSVSVLRLIVQGCGGGHHPCVSVHCERSVGADDVIYHLTVGTHIKVHCRHLVERGGNGEREGGEREQWREGAVERGREGRTYSGGRAPHGEVLGDGGDVGVL